MRFASAQADKRARQEPAASAGRTARPAQSASAQRAALPASARAGSGAWPVLILPASLQPPRRAPARRAGSGKTLAFLLPLVVRARRAARRGEPGVKALVVSPTRELAAQTARALARLVAGLGLRCSLATAASAGTDFSWVRAPRDAPGPCERCGDKLPALLAVSAGALPMDTMSSWVLTSAIARPGDRASMCLPVGHSAPPRLSPTSGLGPRPPRLPALHLGARLMRPRSQGGCEAVCMSPCPYPACVPHTRASTQCSSAPQTRIRHNAPWRVVTAREKAESRCVHMPFWNCLRSPPIHR